MANNDYMHAIIEAFGALITLVVAFIFMIITGNEKKSAKNLFFILIAAGLSLLFDAGGYMFNGNTTRVGFILNMLSDFALFIWNPIMTIFVNKYASNLLSEVDVKPNTKLMYSAYVLSFIAIALTIINLFCPILYDFDENNNYYRNAGWNVYTVVNSLSLMACFIMIMLKRFKISYIQRIALYGFFIAPAAGIVFQVLQVGVSYIQFGMALGSIFIVACYMIEWIRTEKNEAGVSEEKKRLWIIDGVFLIMILFISAAIMTFVLSIRNVSTEDSEQKSTALAYMISASMDKALNEPINVSKTIAQSEVVLNALASDNLENTEVEQKMLEFMQRVREEFDYQMVFVASEKTKAFYLHDELSRYMDTSPGSDDEWYERFKNGNSQYELNIDNDKDNNMDWAIFINMEVRDENGNFLGVCGVGMNMNSVVNTLLTYESTYNLDIALVDKAGLIQIDTDIARIKKDTFDVARLMIGEEYNITYFRDNNKAVMTKNMQSSGWCLVVEDNDAEKLDVIRIILPSMIIYILGIIIMLAFIFFFSIHEERRSTELVASKLQSEAAQAESNAKGKFLANMSHEIRTPINAILGMDSMILRESKEPQIKDYAMIIQNSGNLLLSLINDILDISKIESGKMEIIPEDYDFSLLLSDVVTMVSNKASQKKLDFILDIDQSLPAGLFGDDVRLKQIIVNIVSNAVKYTEKGSVTLIVKGELSDDIVKLYFCVKDTGIGIKEEDLHKLFEDFVRIEEYRNKNIEGTGLGMSITVQLLKLMNSKLEVSSVYGKGSEFSFVLEQGITSYTPIGDLGTAIHKKAANYEYKSMFTAPQAKVLVVDDISVNRLVFIDLLKETKMQIDQADGGESALNLIFNKSYDIIFLDHMMPDMDGIEVIKNIKANPAHPNVKTPIIALTANAINSARDEYLAVGFTDYLSKPIVPNQLETIISKYLPAEKVIMDEVAVTSDASASEELPSIEGIDWNYAKLHLADNVILMNTIRSFAASIESEAAGLNDLYNQLMQDNSNKEVLDLYRIKVHAMKGTATLLGCVPIAGVAATLEYAARGGQLDLIKDMTPHFIKEWLKYNEKLAFAKPASEAKKEIDDVSLIHDYIHQLMDAIQEFDVDGADSVLAKLVKYEYSPEVEAEVEKMKAAVAALDTDTVVALCESVLAKIEA